MGRTGEEDTYGEDWGGHLCVGLGRRTPMGEDWGGGHLWGGLGRRTPMGTEEDTYGEDWRGHMGRTGEEDTYG